MFHQLDLQELVYTVEVEFSVAFARVVSLDTATRRHNVLATPPCSRTTRAANVKGV